MVGEKQDERPDPERRGSDAPDDERGVLPDLVDTRRLPLLPLLMATGTALVVYVISGVSLALAVVVTIAIFLGVFVLGWLRLHPIQRAEAKRRAAVGATAGAVGTAAYDMIRPVHIALADLSFWPFDIFEVFGTALVGEGRPFWLIMAAGIGFHIANGIGFATAYTLLMRRPNLWNGIVFALVLETFMVVIYPNWLGLEGVFLEFLTVSFTGHLVYGAVVGLTAKWLLGRWRGSADHTDARDHITAASQDESEGSV